MASHKVTLIVITALCLGQGMVRAQESSVLSRPSGTPDMKTTTDGAIASLLNSARVPGGIISFYDRCQQPSPQRFFLQGVTLEQGLDSVASIDSSRKWTYRDGVILVGIEIENRTILSTAIPNVEINTNDALSLSTQQLLQSAEVRDRVKAMKLEEVNSELGFSAVRRDGNATEDLPTPAPKHLHQVTLEEALTFLARTNGKAVWLYEQFECGGKATFRITWVVK